MTLELSFRSLKDFEPESIVRQIPELNRLLQIRNALRALKGPLGNKRAFVKMIEQLVASESEKTRLLQELGIEEPDLPTGSE